MNESKPLMKCRKRSMNVSRKNRMVDCSKRQRETLQVRLCWLPALRWHDFLLGTSMELGKYHLNVKERSLLWEKLKETSDVRAYGGVACSSGEALVMRVERRGNIFSSKLQRNLEKGSHW